MVQPWIKFHVLVITTIFSFLSFFLFSFCLASREDACLHVCLLACLPFACNLCVSECF